jgi:predicted transcriptional regulator
MASITIKGTYALDPETVGMLDELARIKGMSKSAVLRDAIRQAAAAEAGTRPQAAEALDRLRGLVARDRKALDNWGREVAAERRASSVRSEKDRR